MELAKFLDIVKDYSNFKWDRRGGLAVVYIGNYLSPIVLDINNDEKIFRVKYSNTSFINNSDYGIILEGEDITVKTVELATKILFCPIKTELELIKGFCGGLEWIVENFEDHLTDLGYIIDVYNSDFLPNKYRDPKYAKRLQRIRSYVHLEFPRITFGYNLLKDAFEVTKDAEEGNRFYTRNDVELVKNKIDEIIRSTADDK